MVYKLPQLDRQEIQAMFGLDELKKTRYFQEVAEEYEQKGEIKGQLKMVPLLLEAGFSIEEIAARAGMDVATVRQVAQQQSGSGQN